MKFEHFGIVTVLFYLSGLICAVIALWRSRTYQGAAAWVVSLIGFPFIAVPAFLFFGRNKFLGYSRKKRELDQTALREMKESQKAYKNLTTIGDKYEAISQIALRSRLPGFTSGNSIQLLINAEATYESMLTAIDQAQKYILFQFYIFREDGAGFRFKERLIKKAREGVRVHFLYDRVGTDLSSRFIREMKSAGIQMVPFESSHSRGSRFQINFRNHRKLVVTDGKIAFLGGHNIGDDYLGLWESTGPWRDTHVRIEGPAALAAQISFAQDWYWAENKMPDLDWTPVRSGDSNVIVIPTGPADDFEACLLNHLALVLAAKKRVWISNPYFVPPEGFSNALMIALMNGVDVRILLPSKNDNALVNLAAKPHLERLLKLGVKFYSYKPAFAHQKIVMIDDDYAQVSSVNLDSRSFFLNFEILAGSTDKEFVSSVEAMLKKDFENSQEIFLKDMQALPFTEKILCRAANLIGPMI